MMGGKGAQALALLRLIYAFQIMSKGMSAACTAIMIHDGFLYLVISNFAHPSAPTLKELPLTARAFHWTLFCITLTSGSFRTTTDIGKGQGCFVDALPQCAASLVALLRETRTTAGSRPAAVQLLPDQASYFLTIGR
jgi:hypothetical protein